MESKWKKYRHCLYLLYIPVYAVWFILLEKHVTENYWVSYVPFDDKIPFVPAFVVAYVLWYPYLFGTGLYAMARDAAAFRRYMAYTIGTLSTCLFICTIFPNGQNLRPDLTGRYDIFSRLIALLYAADTNTNSLPSMHVVGSVGAMLGVFDLTRKKWLRAASVVLCVLICASTVFIKQHSILDTLAGFAVAAVFALPVYGRYFAKRKKEERLAAK